MERCACKSLEQHRRQPPTVLSDNGTTDDGGIYVCSTIALPERCRVDLAFALPGTGLIQAEATVTLAPSAEDARRRLEAGGHFHVVHLGAAAGIDLEQLGADNGAGCLRVVPAREARTRALGTSACRHGIAGTR
mgnify:CR=1 FL=1